MLRNEPRDRAVRARQDVDLRCARLTVFVVALGLLALVTHLVEGAATSSLVAPLLAAAAITFACWAVGRMVATRSGGRSLPSH